MKIILREAGIFLAITIILALLWHNDLLTSPIARVDRLFGSAAASPLHPLMWGAIVYFVVGVFRLPSAIMNMVQNRKRRSSQNGKNAE